ncbi:DUF4854 domain-containing protein [Lachnospiraceae bacterium MD335]|nr:DUF4854 domain-containing protein [Lachnospiraceae bacterium MD335]
MVNLQNVSELNTYLCMRRGFDMKKKIVNVLLSAAVIATMMFSVTACGAKTDEVQDTAADTPVSTVQDDVADVQESTTQAQESTAAPESTVAAEGQMSLEEWTESEECKQFLDMMNEGMADQGVTVLFEVDGDVISLVYQYNEQIEVADNAEEAMSELFSSNASLFESVRDELISETGNENTVLRIEYRNADDSVVYSQDF